MNIIYKLFLFLFIHTITISGFGSVKYLNIDNITLHAIIELGDSIQSGKNFEFSKNMVNH